MEKPDRLDDAIREKLDNLEAEPSARVWMNIRREINPAPKGNRFWVWGVAAAAAVLLLFTGIFVLRSNDAANPNLAANSLRGEIRNFTFNLPAKSKNVPAPDLKSPGVPQPFLAQQPQKNQQVKEQQQPNQQLPEPRQQPELKKDQQQWTPQMDNPIAEIPETPEQADPAPQQQVQQSAPVASAQTNKNNNQKRAKSSPLKVIAAAGRNILGLDMAYKENTQQNTYAFHADLGLFKVERSAGR